MLQFNAAERLARDRREIPRRRFLQDIVDKTVFTNNVLGAWKSFPFTLHPAFHRWRGCVMEWPCELDASLLGDGRVSSLS